ncbi:MAG: class I SAM-dependent methyltransferase [Chitinispirillaceae bacterium]|nr:class I SAM-dependent methyltransferase [Chitinispirillaceae bacterium]
MAEGITDHRAFSDDKHRSGEWRTRAPGLMRGPFRFLACYISYKRCGVDALARATPHGALVMDIGAGQGAYAQWFSMRKACPLVAVDLSFEALRRIGPLRRGKVMRVCADATKLPLKHERAAAVYSVDMLGHVGDAKAALDEMFRVAADGARLFLHSECGDYRHRWPDRMLEKRLGYDLLARHDGHVSLPPRASLQSIVMNRFHIDRIWSPAGITGWLTGYPEKYRLAFRAAGRRWLARVTALFAVIKKAPLAGVVLRLLNSTLNHIEVALGLEGGGSVFMQLRKPFPDKKEKHGISGGNA